MGLVGHRKSHRGGPGQTYEPENLSAGLLVPWPTPERCIDGELAAEVGGNNRSVELTHHFSMRSCFIGLVD